MPFPRSKFVKYVTAITISISIVPPLSTFIYRALGFGYYRQYYPEAFVPLADITTALIIVLILINVFLIPHESRRAGNNIIILIISLVFIAMAQYIILYATPIDKIKTGDNTYYMIAYPFQTDTYEARMYRSSGGSLGVWTTVPGRPVHITSADDGKEIKLTYAEQTGDIIVEVEKSIVDCLHTKPFVVLCSSSQIENLKSKPR